jgi:hypothetical protein
MHASSHSPDCRGLTAHQSSNCSNRANCRARRSHDSSNFTNSRAQRFVETHVRADCTAELKNSREVQTLSHNFLFYHCIVYFRIQPALNSYSMAADEPANVRACSTVSTSACTVPDLLSLFEKYQKVLTGRRESKPPRILRFVHTLGCTAHHGRS